MGENWITKMAENWITKMAENWEITDIRLHFHHIFRSSKDRQDSEGMCYRSKIWDDSHAESGRSTRKKATKEINYNFKTSHYMIVM